MSWRFDHIAAALGLWLLGGIYTDGWAHNHIHVETFFTPWHAVLYSGFLANLILYAITAIRNRRAGKTRIPEGYRLAALGVAIFAVSGVADLIWHTIFGIEVSVSAGSSPPHLGIMVGTGLIVTGPFAAWWKRSASPAHWRDWAALLLSITMALSLMTFVTQYANPLVVISASVQPLRFHDQALGAISILLHVAILMGWILISVARWKLPSGGLIFIVGLNGLAMAFMRDRWFLVPSVAVAGIIADLLLHRMDASASRIRLRVFAFAVPVIYCWLYFAAVGIEERITWPMPLGTGSAFMAGVVSLLISLLIVPSPIPRGADRGQSTPYLA